FSATPSDMSSQTQSLQTDLPPVRPSATIGPSYAHGAALSALYHETVHMEGGRGGEVASRLKKRYRKVTEQERQVELRKRDNRRRLEQSRQKHQKYRGVFKVLQKKAEKEKREREQREREEREREEREREASLQSPWGAERGTEDMEGTVTEREAEHERERQYEERDMAREAEREALNDSGVQVQLGMDRDTALISLSLYLSIYIYVSI
ncbi:hypothetical protein KIPB_012187, partial [Kipferlia bialata]